MDSRLRVGSWNSQSLLDNFAEPCATWNANSPFFEVIRTSFALSLLGYISDASNFPNFWISAIRISSSQILSAIKAYPRKILGNTFFPNWWILALCLSEFGRCVSSFSFSMWQIVHYIDIDICTLTQFSSLPLSSLVVCFFFFSLSSDGRSSVVQHPPWLVHALGSNRPWFSCCLCETRTVRTVILTSYMVAEPVLWDCRFIKKKTQIYEDATVLWTITERHGERTFLDLRWQMPSVTQWWRLWRVRRRDAHPSDQGHSPGDIQSRRWNWTDPVDADASSQWPQIGIQRRGYDAEHGSRRSRAVDEWRKRLVPEGADQQWERVHTDRRVGRMSRMPAELGSMREPRARGKENHVGVNNNHQDTQRFWGEEQFEPRTNWAADKPRNTMLEDVDEPMPAKPWCDHAESAISPLEETDSAAVHIEVLRSPSSWNPRGGA